MSDAGRRARELYRAMQVLVGIILIVKIIIAYGTVAGTGTDGELPFMSFANFG